MSFFDGGGFASPGGGGGGGGFGSPNASAQKSSRTRVQNLVPCTINQIRTAGKEDDRFMIGSMELGQVEIFGVIMDSREATTNITYMINDFTGEDIEVRHWLEEADDEAGPTKESQMLKKHTLVRVCGNVREFQGTRNLVAFRIFPVHDYNEFSCHILEVIHSQLMHHVMEKGIGGSVVVDGPSTSGYSTIGSTPAGPAPVRGLPKNQEDVLRAIQQGSVTESGPSIAEIRSSLGNRLSEAQIRDAIEYLSGEGHIYSTLDEDHYRATDA